MTPGRLYAFPVQPAVWTRFTAVAIAIASMRWAFVSRARARDRTGQDASHLDAGRVKHHDDHMRTTLTLDPDVARMIQEEVHRVRKPLKRVVNEALRRGLTGTGRRRPLKAYRVVPHAARLMPGVDRARLNALADELEDAAIAGRARGRKPS